MCTVTFLPQKDIGNFILTSSRDEDRGRKRASFPFYHHDQQYKILMPQDGEAGGTWLASSSSGRTVCLLNGAFNNHKKSPPYRHSRGKVVIDFFTQTIENFYDQYELNNIEPFTLIIVESQVTTSLYEFRWDGEKKHLKTLDITQPHIWSSATLYDPMVVKAREELFDRWLVVNDPKNIKSFHLLSAPLNKENNILMKRENGIETVSISQILFQSPYSNFSYHDMIDDIVYQEKLILNETMV